MKGQMMPRYLTRSLTLVALVLSSVVYGQGIDFFHGTWEEALIEAQKQNRLIFVDCYTTWCGPCKRMARDVFPNPEVGEYYNQHFINVKMDMEKGEGPTFGKTYPVGAYPTLYYIKPDGEVVFSQRGARGVKDFIDLGKAAVGQADLGQDFREAYESGSREPELILELVKSLNRSNEPSLKVVNDFIRSTPAMDDSVNLAIILEGVTESDSRPFEVVTENKRLFESVFGETPVSEKLMQACEATAQKAIDFEYFALVDEAIEDVRKYVPERYDEFRYTAPMDYHLAYHDWAAYYEVVEEYVRKEIRKDGQRLVDLSRSIVDHFDYEPSAIDYAENLLLQAAKYDDSWKMEHALAYFYLQVRKDKAKAKSHAQAALKKAKKQDGEVQMLENFLLTLDGKGVRFTNQ